MVHANGLQRERAFSFSFRARLRFTAGRRPVGYGGEEDGWSLLLHAVKENGGRRGGARMEKDNGGRRRGATKEEGGG